MRIGVGKKRERELGSERANKIHLLQNISEPLGRYMGERLLKG